jgi:predicted nucleic acid-binding protein
MNLVDSCGWLEYLADGVNADKFAPAIESPSTLVVPAICIYEVFRRLLPKHGRSASLEVISAMYQSTIVPLSPVLAVEAAALGHEHGLPLADSVIYACARAYGATVWIQDAHFENLPNVFYFPHA